MAKTKGESTGKMNRVRMIVIDSDLSDDAVSDLSQAIASALHFNQGGHHTRVITPARERPQLASGNGHAPESTVDESDGSVEEEPDSTESAAPRAARPSNRQYYKPKVLPDVDLTVGTKPFVEFAKEKSPSAITKRYLLIAAWFHDFASIETITADHVFTCYRAMGWTLEVKNPLQPFSDVQKQGWGEYKDKKFTINHIGLAQVQKMTAGSE